MRFRFVLAEILHGFRRNASMISAVILVTFVSLASVGAVLMMQLEVDRLTTRWYDKVEVQVWLCAEDAEAEMNCSKGGVTQDQEDAVVAKLESPELSEYVQEVFVESKEDTYARFMERFGGSALSNQVTQASMPPVIHVSLKDPSMFAVVAESVSEMPGVEQVYDQQKMFSQLFEILGKIRAAALGIAGVLALAAVLLITTTIRLSALSRQRETGIMRLVGASNLFIQLPFMLEGAVAAILGSALAGGTLWAACRFWLAKWVDANFALMFGAVRASDVFVVAPWLVLGAVLLAGLSSALTLRRFTRV